MFLFINFGNKALGDDILINCKHPFRHFEGICGNEFVRFDGCDDKKLGFGAEMSLVSFGKGTREDTGDECQLDLLFHCLEFFISENQQMGCLKPNSSSLAGQRCKCTRSNVNQEQALLGDRIFVMEGR